MTNQQDKILVICRYDDSQCNGQIAKTKDVCEFLKNHNYRVDILDYGKMKPFQKFFSSRTAIKKYEKIVLMPGGKRALFFYIKLLNKLKKINTHYVAIGGWVLSLLKNPKYEKVFKLLRGFKGVYLQNMDTVKAFEETGFRNVHYISSFSSKIPLSEEEIKRRNNYFKQLDEFKFCFFARVERTKGVLLACDAIKRIKEAKPDLKISFDIFGEIKDKVLKEELLNICAQNSYIAYKRILSSENAVATLSKYYCLLFPTFYKGEGTPHSVIESYMAGLPVIASDWAYNKEVVKDNETGLIFNLTNNNLYDKILYAIDNPDLISKFSKECLKESKNYNIEKLLKPLLTNLK